jgi:hypothetical protein
MPEYEVQYRRLGTKTKWRNVMHFKDKHAAIQASKACTEHASFYEYRVVELAVIEMDLVG